MRTTWSPGASRSPALWGCSGAGVMASGGHRPRPLAVTVRPLRCSLHRPCNGTPGGSRPHGNGRTRQPPRRCETADESETGGRSGEGKTSLSRQKTLKAICAEPGRGWVQQLKFEASLISENPAGISHSAEVKASCPHRNRAAAPSSERSAPLTPGDKQRTAFIVHLFLFCGHLRVLP